MDGNKLPAKTEFLLYKTEDGKVKIQTIMQNETVWLTQEQMAVLFDKAKSTINEHISNIFEEGELDEGKVMRKFGNSEFSTKREIMKEDLYIRDEYEKHGKKSASSYREFMKELGLKE